MDSIDYSYEILNVDVQAKCMEVKYSAPGHSTIHVGARIPFEDEQLEEVIRSFAPIEQWRNELRSFSVPEVGLSGSLNHQFVFEEVVSHGEEEIKARAMPSGEIPVVEFA